MNIFNDPTTIVMLVIAVFILVKLRSVLGKRTGNERPPFDPSRLERRKGVEVDDAGSGNVVTISRRSGSSQARPASAPSQTDLAIDAIAKPGTKLNGALKEVSAADPGFDPASFLDGAKMAYEMIVTAFADGDRKTLKNLLSREVYEGFSNALSEREAKGHHVRASFVGIDSAAITAAEFLKPDIHVTTRFVSQIISATYDSEDKLIDGDPEQVAEVTDIWTFSRDSRSRDPNWKLVATESES
ncbi:MAG: Tim44 domain-containing protein [Nitratireductor sp.]|nr:Tim44 domain-containing protein [Nitratireductor sp.]MCB1457174.1 Tim44 domain-containing protein [Nitratireductor sp.]MCB1460246.1 Tim44 domain-containing protein [Nitratireductor sp.]